MSLKYIVDELIGGLKVIFFKTTFTASFLKNLDYKKKLYSKMQPSNFEKLVNVSWFRFFSYEELILNWYYF